jgi:hypothetical protein
MTQQKIPSIDPLLSAQPQLIANFMTAQNSYNEKTKTKPILRQKSAYSFVSNYQVK